MRGDRTQHGGSLNAGKRKTKRPFVPKRVMHVVVRSSKARGEQSFLKPRHSKSIQRILHHQAKKHVVKIYEYVNVGNHLHIKLKPYSRDGFTAFLKSTTALIARKITGARKGRSFGKFWDALAYTRILQSDFEEKSLFRYFRANELEARFGREVREIFLSG